MSRPLPWKTAWITGASTGIGREIALQLAASGVKVVASARSAEKLASLGPDILGMPLDVTDSAACRAAFAPLPGWRLDSLGAYFAFAAHPFPGLPAREAARKLALEAGVLALPGPYFGPGQESHLRIAFANVGADKLDELGTRLSGV